MHIKIFITLLTTTLSLNTIYADIYEGCCSHHDGISSCGYFEEFSNDEDDSNDIYVPHIISCNDGWTESSCTCSPYAWEQALTKAMSDPNMYLDDPEVVTLSGDLDSLIRHNLIDAKEAEKECNDIGSSWGYQVNIKSTPVGIEDYRRLDVSDGTCFQVENAFVLPISWGEAVLFKIQSDRDFPLVVESDFICSKGYEKFQSECMLEEDVIKNLPFTDLKDSSLESTAAHYLRKKGIISGNPDGSFRGENSVNRAELAKMLLIAKGSSLKNSSESQYKDVSTKDWFFDYVANATRLGIINGDPDGSFRPGDNVNRAEFIKMLSIALNLGEDSKHNFTDTPENAWYNKYLGNVKKYALFPDESYKVWLKPGQPVTRFETAIAIYTILNNQ